MIEVSNNPPVTFVYVHRDGRVLWGTKSRTAQDAMAKAMRMDVPNGGHIEEIREDDEQSST
jgi:hypothetical protein